MAARLSLPATAALFARLKLRLFFNGFRGKAAVVIPTLLSLGMSVLVGVGGALAAWSTTGLSSVDAVLAATLIGGLVWVASLLVPAVGGGVDDSLSVERLAQFPLARRQRLVGLLAAGVVSPPMVGVALALTGFIVARLRSLGGAPLVLVGAAITFATVLVTSKLVVALLAPLMSSRKGRDVGVMLGALVGLTGLLANGLMQLAQQFDRADYQRVEPAVRWLPGASALRSMVDAGAGRLGAAVGSLAVAAVWLAALVAVWLVALGRAERSLTKSEAHGDSGVANNATVFGAVWGRLPRTVMGAVAARELRYARRDPRWRVSAVMSLVVGVAAPLVSVVQGEASPERTMLGASTSLLGALTMFNVVGFEGRSLWIHLTSGVDYRSYLVAKNLAVAILFAPVAMITSVMVAAITGGWAYLPAALVLSVALLANGMGFGTCVAVVNPQAPPEGSNPFATNTGAGCVTGLVMVLATVLLGVLQLPGAIALFVVRRSPLACLIVAAIGLVVAIAEWKFFVGWAAKRARGREPELQQATVPRG